MFWVATWNLKGKCIESLGDWLSNNDGYDAIGLQELGGCSEFEHCSPGTLKELRVAEHSELENYHIFIVPANQIESHLSQGILLERASVSMIHRTFAGRRVVGVLARHICGLDLWYIHFPHCNDTDADYACAVMELQQLIQENSSYSFVIAGDFNTVPFENAAGSCGRSESLQATLGQHGLLCLNSGQPTWHGRQSQRELDFFFVSSAVASKVVGSITGFQISVHQGGREELGSDHDLVVLEFLLDTGGVKTHKEGYEVRKDKWPFWNFGRTVESGLSEHAWNRAVGPDSEPDVASWDSSKTP